MILSTPWDGKPYTRITMSDPYDFNAEVLFEVTEGSATILELIAQVAGIYPAYVSGFEISD